MAVKGMKQVLASLKKFEKEAEEDIHVITGDIASQITLNAKNSATAKSFDNGKLVQGIQFFELGKSNYEVVANSGNIAPYSAYVEFGTGGMVRIPEEMRKIARQFIGKGIKEVNLPARPFLYPAFVKGRKQYVKDLKDLLKDLTRKYE